MDDDVYKMRQDQTVTVTFPLVGEKAEALGLTGVRALAWTTTPWTLPTNLALAVGPDIEYAVVPAGPNGAADGHGEPDARRCSAPSTCSPPTWSAPTRRTSATTRAADAQRRGRPARVRGAELERRRATTGSGTTTPTPRRTARENAWRILVADYVTTEDGTGIVHQAPAYGEDDQRVCEAAGIPVIISVDDGGRFLPERRRMSPACRSSRPTSRSPSCCARTAACCARRATSTATRTAGAAATR